MDAETRSSAVKMVAEDDGTFTVGGYGVVWGGADVARDRFTPETDFWFDRLTENPMVLYRHGLEGKMARTVVGQVTEKKADDFGLWIEAQVKDHEEYSEALRTLVQKGVLGWSSGAVGHLVDKVKKGGVNIITSWPVAEWSLVPDPCEPRTIGVAEVKAISTELAETLDSLAVKAKLTAAQRKKLPDSDYAYIDSDGNRHLPINDEAHVRAALSRFSQTQFESPSARTTARRKIMTRAKRLGIDVADKSGKSWSLEFMDATVCDETCCDSYKALPDGPTMMSDDDGGCYPEGSYEDLADDIARALRVQTGSYAYVVATFPGYALVRCCDDDAEMDDYGYPSAMAYFRVAYQLDDEGEPTLGGMEKVEPAMIPVSAKAALTLPQSDEAPLAIQAARLSDYAALFADHTKGVHERRQKEGRVLSETNHAQLVKAADGLDSTLKAMRDLLATSEPQSAKAASDASVDPTEDLERLAMDFEVLRMFADTLDPAA